MATRLTVDICDRLEQAFRSRGIPAMDYLSPGLSDDEIDAIVAPTDLLLPDEVRVWWRWRNGTNTDAIDYTSDFLPDRKLYPLDYAVEYYLYVGAETPRLHVVSEIPTPEVLCRATGDVPAPVELLGDWAAIPEPAFDSLGDLVLTWISYIENDVYLRAPSGHWVNQPEGHLPADVVERGVY